MFNICSCSEHCPGVLSASSERCPGVSEKPPNQLNFYRATVPLSAGSVEMGVFQSLDFKLNGDLGRSVNLSNTALHYPVDIYDRGR